MKKTSIIITLLILIGILLLIWLPYFFHLYSLFEACVITISAFLGGFIGEYIKKRFY